MKTTARALPGRVLALAMLIAPHSAHSQINNAIAGNNGTVPTPVGLYVTPFSNASSGSFGHITATASTAADSRVLRVSGKITF